VSLSGGTFFPVAVRRRGKEKGKEKQGGGGKGGGRAAEHPDSQKKRVRGGREGKKKERGVQNAITMLYIFSDSRKKERGRKRGKSRRFIEEGSGVWFGGKPWNCFLGKGI